MTTPIREPVIRKRKWPLPLIWIFPLITAVGAGLYFRDYLANHGPEITIEFTDASGLRVGESKINYRGADIGKITAITLSENHRHAIVHAQLEKREDIFASKGAEFWIVRPEVSESGLSGLGTLFTGPYIAAIPGKDEESQTQMEGLARAPRAYEEGEHFILTSIKMGHVQDGSAVYYKGMPVGTVQEIELANEADHLNVHIVVWSRYAALVRTNSKFWVTSGFDFKAGLFSGVQVRLDSLKTLAAGGVAFATPEKDMQGPAKNGTQFALESEPKKEWEQWSPHISISPREHDSTPAAVVLPVAKTERKK
jgi:paraquat-inducible protein B